MISQFTPRTKVNIPLSYENLSGLDQVALADMECYQLPNHKMSKREEKYLTGKDVYYVSHHGIQVPDQIILENGIYSTYRFSPPKTWTEQSDPNLAVVALKLMRWDDHPWVEKVYPPHTRRKKDDLDREVGL